MNSPMGRRTDTAMVTLCAVVPPIVAALHTGNVAAGADDGGVARVLGLRPDAWRALDVWVGSLLALAPVGTQAARAALGCALAAGAAGAALYAVARSLLAAVAPTPRLGFVVAAIASLTVTLSVPWQAESAAVGGEVTGALLVFLPMALLGDRQAVPLRPLSIRAAFALGLAFGYTPAVGVCAALGCAAWLLMTTVSASRPPMAERVDGLDQPANAWRPEIRSLAAAALLGLMPWVLALAHARTAGVPIARALAGAPFESRAATSPAAGAVSAGLVHPAAGPLQLVGEHAGAALGLLALAGAALGAATPRARPLAASLASVAAVGVAATWIGSPPDAGRFAAPWLASFASLVLFAGSAMHAIARAVARARVPLARSSAALVVVLEAVFPVDEADEALATWGSPSDSASVWDEVAWGLLPPRSVVLVTQGAALEARAAASRLQGGLRDDVLVLPICMRCAPPWRDLADEPMLVPLWRDVAMNGAPSEASLSALAGARPVVMAYEPRWGFEVGRHLIPMMLFDRFEPEPRGSSDRRRALDALAPTLDRLATATALDPVLARITAILLGARVALIAASGDRTLAERAASQAAMFTR